MKKTQIMRFLVHPLHPRYHASTRTLILSAAPERRECLGAWSQTPSDLEANEYIRRDYVAVDTSDPPAVAAYGAIWPQGRGRFRMDLIVAQAWRRQGVGSALLQTLLEALRAQKATLVQARTPDTRSEALAFLLGHGFTETNRMIHLRLPVANVSLAPLTALTARLEAQGITIVTLDREQAQAPDCPAKVQALIQATMPARVSNPYQAGSDTEFCSAEDAKLMWESSHPLRPDAFFLAKQDAGYVGLSFLSEGETARSVVQGDTAVHTDWRRQGIATLLKLHTIAYAQQHGYAEIATATASPGMLALNQRLGFEQEWAEVRLVKALRDV